MTEIVPNILVSLTGKPKGGKNHFSYTFPAPVRVYCFNGGADFVRKKFDKQIDIVNISLPILESTDAETWATPIWEKFYNDYKKSINEGVYKTYVIDTGTELETVLRQAVLEEIQDASMKHREKLATTEYGARNMRMSAIFSRARNAGVNLVVLQYVKEKWEKNQATGKAEPSGEYILDGWAQTEAQVDVPMEIEEKKKGDKSVMIATIKQNRFDRNFNRTTYEDFTYDELVAVLFS